MQCILDLPDEGFNVAFNSDYGPLIANRQDVGQPHFIRKNGQDHNWPLLTTLASLYSTVISKRDGPGSMLDIGANIGSYSLFFGRRFPALSIYAFEAQRLMFYALCGNIALGSYQSIFAYHTAISNSAGNMKIPALDYHKPASFGSFSLLESTVNDTRQNLNYQQPHETVMATVLDQHDYGRLDFIKVDIEGMELMALEGAQQHIKTYRPFIFLEWLKSDLVAIHSWLTSQDYHCYVVRDDLIALNQCDLTQKKIVLDGASLLTHQQAVSLEEKKQSKPRS